MIWHGVAEITPTWSILAVGLSLVALVIYAMSKEGR